MDNRNQSQTPQNLKSTTQLQEKLTRRSLFGRTNKSANSKTKNSQTPQSSSGTTITPALKPKSKQNNKKKKQNNSSQEQNSTRFSWKIKAQNEDQKQKRKRVREAEATDPNLGFVRKVEHASREEVLQREKAKARERWGEGECAPVRFVICEVKKGVSERDCINN